jgi:UDP-N-acetylmuramyl pentapeptide phosphotransferase/UDP-N-acetylglucosamine-1-phosphate transferase
MKTHKVGTITFGGMLVLFGVLFLLHIFLPALSYTIIFRLWPIIFIFLGLEVLIANYKLDGEKLIYDKTAFALIIILSFFAMSMAIADFCINHVHHHVVCF